MNSNRWPWTWEEEAEWTQQLQQQEFGWMEEWIDHRISDALAGYHYDPLELQDRTEQDRVEQDRAEEETTVY